MKKSGWIAVILGLIITFLIIRYPLTKTVTLSKTTVSFPNSHGQQADQVLRKLIFGETEENRVLWKLEAEESELNKETNIALLDKVAVVFFQKSGDQWNIIGQKGRVNTRTMNMSIWGDVVATSDEEVTLTTDLLNWDNQKRKIFTDEKVRITRAGYILDGIGMEFDIDQEKLEVKEQITSRIDFSR